MKKKSDFTLVELVIVIAIFAIAAAVFSGCNPLESNHRKTCTNNLKQIGNALELYSTSNDSKLPAGPAPVGAGGVDVADFYGGERAGGFELLRWTDVLTDYNVYVCPSSSTKAGKGTDSLTWGNSSKKANVSYAYKPGMVKGDSNDTGRPGSGVCADLTGDVASANDGDANHRKFGNILYLDGHVRGYEGSGWFSPEKAGYPDYRPGTRIMIPNTLRNAKTGKAD